MQTRLLKKELIAGIASSFFDALFMGCGIGIDIGSTQDKGKLILNGDLFDKFGVVGRIGAQLVIKMRDDKRISLLMQRAEQTKAIRTARDGDDDGKMRREENYQAKE